MAAERQCYALQLYTVVHAWESSTTEVRALFRRRRRGRGGEEKRKN